MLDTLKKINEWWETKEIPTELAPETKRQVFNEVVELFEDRRIIGVLGPRRTGKTTLMFQLMNMLIQKRHVDPKHILFFSCDDVDFRETENVISEILRLYFEDFLKQDYRAERCYIFIDEIHWIPDWQQQLKKFYDLKYHIKFIISGSSAAKIKKDQRESLAGRLTEFTLFPLSFSEFLQFNQIQTDEPVHLQEMTYDRLCQVKNSLGPKQVLTVKKHFDEYVLVGGLPEWFETQSLKKWQKKLTEDIIKRVLYDDVATLYNVKNTFKLEKMLRLLASLHSRTYSYNSLADTLKMDNETAEQYIGYLKESYILFELFNYAASKEKQLRKNYKYIIFDSGVRNALERITTLDHPEIGYIIEGVIHQHLLWNQEKERSTVLFWREKNLVEVDAIVRSAKTIIPIEVKYQQHITRKDLVGLLRFMEINNLQQGIVVTKETFEEKKIDEKTLLCVPAWLFLFVYHPTEQ